MIEKTVWTQNSLKPSATIQCLYLNLNVYSEQVFRVTLMWRRNKITGFQRYIGKGFSSLTILLVKVQTQWLKFSCLTFMLSFTFRISINCLRDITYFSIKYFWDKREQLGRLGFDKEPSAFDGFLFLKLKIIKFGRQLQHN